MIFFEPFFFSMPGPWRADVAINSRNYFFLSPQMKSPPNARFDLFFSYVTCRQDQEEKRLRGLLDHGKGRAGGKIEDSQDGME